MGVGHARFPGLVVVGLPRLRGPARGPWHPQTAVSRKNSLHLHQLELPLVDWHRVYFLSLFPGFYPGLDIESSLKQLAERRTDIFGVEETAIGKKIGEEEIQKPEEKVRSVTASAFLPAPHSRSVPGALTSVALLPVQVTWDGHSGSMARTQQAAQANITLQEQIEAIHKAKGLVPEDDTKEKIGPSKPSEIPQQPLPPSSATNIPSLAPPITVGAPAARASPQPPRRAPEVGFPGLDGASPGQWSHRSPRAEWVKREKNL